MSSITEMINNAFEQKVFNKLQKISSPEYSSCSFVIASFKNNNVNSRLRLYSDDYGNGDEDIGDDEVALIYDLWNLDTEQWRTEVSLFSFPKSNLNHLEEDYSKEICRFMRYFLKNLNNLCKYCSNPFEFESDLLNVKTIRHNLITNFCKLCGNIQLVNLHTNAHLGELNIEEICCDICNEKMIEKDTEDKIKFNKMNKMTCCKGKFLCKNCFSKQTDKCFFCRKKPEWECLTFGHSS